MNPIVEAAIPIYDPTVEPEIETEDRTSRDGALSGKRIGLLWNSKVGADKLMRYILDELRADGADPDLAVELSKEYDTRPAKPEVYAEMAEKCDLAITAVGD